MVTTTTTYTLQIWEPGDRGQLPIVAGWYPVRKNLPTEAAARWAAVNITRTRPASEPDRFFRILGPTGEVISL